MLDSGGMVLSRRAERHDERQRGDLLSSWYSSPVNHGGGVPELKTKPTQVIVHRLELQTKERDLLESAVMAYQFNKVAVPVVSLLKDVTGLAAFFLILNLLLGLKPDEDGEHGALASLVFDYIQAEDDRQSTGVSGGAAGRKPSLGNIWYNIRHPNFDWQADWGTFNGERPSWWPSWFGTWPDEN